MVEITDYRKNRPKKSKSLLYGCFWRGPTRTSHKGRGAWHIWLVDEGGTVGSSLCGKEIIAKMSLTAKERHSKVCKTCKSKLEGLTNETNETNETHVPNHR